MPTTIQSHIPLVAALHHQPLATPPLWLMRQAGRYLPEYRVVRSKFPNFIQFCLTPNAATEVTIQPVNRFNLSAAIIFSDILTIPHALGHTVTFTEGHGPHVEPFTSTNQLTQLIHNLPTITEKLAPVSQTVHQTRQALPADKAVIGFSGGPFTLACYMCDAKPSQGIPNTLTLMQQDSQTFTQLLNILTQACTSYLASQIQAGANAIQLFESWALACPQSHYTQAVIQPLLTISKALKQQFPTTPIILFPRGATQAQLQEITSYHYQNPQGTFNSLSLSTEANLAWAHQVLQPQVAIQGNLDPLLMTGPRDEMLKAATQMLNTTAIKPGYIVNLGHGLTPQTNPDNVQALSDLVHTWQPPK
ncbi:MAG: uroporphyrinogen decarboxylase [Proteobacteria bacterium]|nr:uroporphyrinogen decarboxylase [Bacteroidota bacterium]NBX85979.1 uroporphyrinogen decarboxylase [Pseudomonadota bacterium]